MKVLGFIALTAVIAGMMWACEESYYNGQADQPSGSVSSQCQDAYNKARDEALRDGVVISLTYWEQNYSDGYRCAAGKSPRTTNVQH